MNRIRTKIRRWWRRTLPNWMFAYDFEIFTAILCLLGGLPLIFGRVEPTSLEAQLHPYLVLAWGLILCVGPVAIIVGIARSHNAEEIEDQLFWQRTEAWGLTALAYAAYIYAGAIFLTLSRSGWIAACLVVAFGFTCHLREVDIQLKITDMRYRLGLGG